MSGRTNQTKGENIKLVMERNGIDKAVYLGDTIGDQLAAKDAEIPFVFASYGFGTTENPEYTISSFDELLKVAEKMYRFLTYCDTEKDVNDFWKEYIGNMNEIIAVNGSSPAYIYLFAKAMADYAKNCGIEYDKAMNLVCATLEGSAAMLRDSGEPVETLIDRVCSKGGTTIAAMDKLKEHGFYEAVLDGMDACTKRAEELGK
jgi:hypothetical protein